MHPFPKNRILLSLFLPNKLTDLIQRDWSNFANIRGWRSEYDNLSLDEYHDLSVQITISDYLDEKIDKSIYSDLRVRSVFIPPKEVLSFYYGFISLYEKREVDYDLTYPELCRELSTPLLRKNEDSVAGVLADLEKAMGGTVKIEGNRFVFVPTGSTESLSINLYA